MEPFTSTSENPNILPRRRKRESEKYKTNLKVQNFHLQKPFIKNAKSPNVFSNPFFFSNPTSASQQKLKRKCKLPTYIESKMKKKNKKHSPAVE